MPRRTALRKEQLNNEDLILLIQENGNFGDVDSGNYSEFEEDGTLKFHGSATVFKDELGQLLYQIKGNPSDKIVDNIDEGSLTFKDNATKDNFVVMSIQLNHDRKHGADVYPHLHWWQSTENIPNWLIEYRWQRNGFAKETEWIELGPLENAFVWESGEITQITRFNPISPPSDDNVSDILQLKLSRDVNGGSAIYETETSPVDQDAISLDIHVEIDTIGSREEYIK